MAILSQATFHQSGEYPKYLIRSKNLYLSICNFWNLKMILQYNLQFQVPKKFKSKLQLRSRRIIKQQTTCQINQPHNNSTTYGATIKKPLGLILVENDKKQVFVEEVVADGNAAKDGRVKVGDIMIGCSAVVLKKGKEGQYEQEGYAARPYTNWEKVEFDCQGQDFDTVMKAISSNNERWGFNTVDLKFKRYQ
eukprot:TRINITY_DN7437_c0_g1_i2.p1 TRINITY_DN7437_c0_g1~~TRINITY_DN7437_c0_g1_i2.p1  ORF type:complete len:214 (-),score=10.24 TRINITY_DN7437_c0_g1_i2:174-752(-)